MARFSRLISTIDSHTAGECTRVVTAGLPPIPGQTMAEKLAFAAEHLSWLPGFLLLEPRGHKDMYGAVLVPPADPAADAGVLFMDNRHFEPMCGHGLIGVVTTLLETGIIDVSTPGTQLMLDTAAGPVHARAHAEQEHVVSVTFDNVPAFVVCEGLRIDVPDVGTLAVDIAFGGNFFALIDARQLGLELVPANATRLATLGMRVLEAVNSAVPVRHPDLPDIDSVIDVRFYIEPGSGGARSRNVVVLGDHMIDRSPCGTGTCAELALRYARGELGLGEPMISESILGTQFTGRVLRETHVGQGPQRLPAVIPTITGSAHITGLHQFLLDPNDPFPEGFLQV